MKRDQKGFTLAQLMSVTAIIALMALLVLPSVIRMELNVNEAAAQTTLLTLRAAMDDYKFARTPASYPFNLTQLANANPPYIVQQIADNSTYSPSIRPGNFNGYKGYVFRYETSFVFTANGIVVTNYTLYALPVQEGLTGSSYFSMTSRGDIIKVPRDTAVGSSPGG